MKINISILSTDFSPDKGGIQNWMFYLCKLLKINFNNVNTYSYKKDSFYKYFKTIKSDIFFLSTWKQAFFIFPILLITSKKIFIFIHGSELLNINSFYKYIFSYLLIRKNTYFIANSDAIGVLFFKTTGRSVNFIQHPFGDYSNTWVSRINNTKSEINFFTVCRLDKRKNIKNTIVALQNLMINKGLKFNYTIAGFGDEYPQLEQLIESNNLQDNIRLYGAISDEEKEVFFKNNDYFLMPSIFDKEDGDIEGFGIVFIEACYYGLPSLCGDTGGMVEAVIHNKTGFHCDGSIDDIMNKIEKMIKFNFNKVVLQEHAKRFDYKNQRKLIKFIKDCEN